MELVLFVHLHVAPVVPEVPGVALRLPAELSPFSAFFCGGGGGGGGSDLEAQ